MDAMEHSNALRQHETTAVRTAEAEMSIDPGFVHHRLIQNVLGVKLMAHVNDALRQIPDNAPEHVRELQTDHVYVDAMVKLCAHIGVPPLAEVLAHRRGHLFASVETTLPCPTVYEAERVEVRVQPKYDAGVDVVMEFATKRIRADTTRMELQRGAELAIIGQIRSTDEHRVQIEPLIIGGPSLQPSSPDLSEVEAMWLGYSFGEIFAEDIDEFSRCTEIDRPLDVKPMKDITERAVKQCLAELLGAEAEKDWGGEQSDLYSAHLHLGGRRVAGAFVLKGPADFRPMRMKHLGANGDQIVRLAQEPAGLLVVQHSHEIGTDVRTTLRAFANGLGPLRRYCLIDGLDTLRILTAYGKLEHAIDLSERERSERRASRTQSSNKR